MTEFTLYDRIISGDLRPHLGKFDSPEGLKELRDQFYSKKVIVEGDFLDKISHDFDMDFHGFKDGDNLEFEINEDSEVARVSIRKVQNPEEEELINLDIPPPPDEKSDLFLRIIESEYNRISSSIVRKIEQTTNLDDLRLYVLKNVQLAKNGARRAHVFEKKLKKSEGGYFDNPNEFILYVLKKYIIYSILEIQEICFPLLGISSQSEHDLEDELFEYEHSRRMSRVKVFSNNMNEMHIARLYDQIGASSSIEEKITFFTNQLEAQLEKIQRDLKSKFGVTPFELELERLYEAELGNLLSDYLLSKLETETNELGIMEKYDKLIKTVTHLNLEGESLRTKALKKTSFFNKIQLQIDYLKEIINVSNTMPHPKSFLRDLISLLLVLQTRKNLKLGEDEWNDYLVDLLRAKQYYISDQSRSGLSGSNDARKQGSGELDISIRDTENSGIIQTIIEAFKLNSCGSKNKIVNKHVSKVLERYDTAGNEENFIIVFATADSFFSLWEKYIDHIEKVVFRGISKFQEIEYGNISKSDIKIGYNQFLRNNKNLKLYHLFVNMNSA